MTSGFSVSWYASAVRVGVRIRLYGQGLCLSVWFLVLVFTAVRVRVRIRRIWARIALVSSWFWCPCSLPCALVCGYGVWARIALVSPWSWCSFPRCVPCCRSQALCPASWPVWTRGTCSWSFTRLLCATTYACAASGRISHVFYVKVCSSWSGFCRARCCARHVPDGPDNAELPGGAAGAVPARLLTSLCSCSDKFPAIPGRGSDPFIDKFETD